MYPELQHAGTVSRTQGFWRSLDREPDALSAFTLIVGSYSGSLPAEPSSLLLRPTVLMSVDVLTDPQGEIWDVDVRGPYVHDEKYQALRDGVQALPEKSEATAVDALRLAGAKLGPWSRPEFVAQTRRRLSSLEPVWGRVLWISVDFLDFVQDGDQRRPILKWQVDVQVGTPRRSRLFRMTFEPFDGRLTDLTRLQARTRSPR